MIIIILNTPDIQHWIIKRYFNLKQIADGYYEIVPKEIEGFMCIMTDYTKNPYLAKHIIRNYENYGNPDSHLYNYHYFMTAIKGYASTGRKGQVLTKVKPIKLAEYLKLPFREVFGLDFGTASPAGIVGVKIDKNNVYARQLNYLPMNTLDIAKFFCRLKLTPVDLIVADSADPKSIRKLQNGYQGHELATDEFLTYPQLAVGFNVKGAKKGPDSVVYGIDLLDQMNLYVVEESADFWTEILSYVYDQDKNGNYTNEPIDDFNHLIDPLRYVVTEMKQSQYIIR